MPSGRPQVTAPRLVPPVNSVNYDTEDTIVAVATPPGGERGIVRLGGPRVLECLTQIFRPVHPDPAVESVTRPRRLRGRVCCQLANRPYEVAAALLYWPTSRSYTRQPLAEVHTWGGAVLLEAILREACRAGARLAEPGEYTLRAFLAGRLDLTQVEAVLGLVEARSKKQLQTALSQMAGGLSRPLGELREQLLVLLAEIEAGLDFVDEDLEFVSLEQVVNQLHQAAGRIATIKDQLGRRSAAGVSQRVVLLGSPNVGKSSLYNAMIARHSRAPRALPGGVALVSDLAGTTRDYLRAEVRWPDGVSCELIDTAGVEDSPRSQIDAESQQASQEQAHLAAIGLVCVDATRGPSELPTRRTCLGATIFVVNKCDLDPAAADRYLRELPPPAIATSCVSGAGIDNLLDVIHQALQTQVTSEVDAVAATATRCRDSLEQAERALWAALETAQTGGGEELIAADIRAALDHLGQVVGAVYTDDILDRIFSNFCIGK